MDPSPRTPPNHVRSLLAEVGQDACYAWRVSAAVALVLLVAPWLGGVLIGVSWADGSVFRFLTGPGSALAWLAVAGWLAAAALGVLIARRLRLAGRERDVVVYAVFALLCALAAGQQSSWGIALLGHDAPSGLALLHRRQDGMLRDLGALMRPLFLIAGCYGAAAPWLLRRRAPSELARLTVPPLFLSSAFLLSTSFEAVRLAFPGATTAAFGQWPELCLALALATFALLTYQRLVRASTPVVPTLASRRWHAAARGH